MIDRLALSGITRGENSLTVLTGLKYNTDLIKFFNNLTFIYDPNWEYNGSGNEATYPMAFFYVKKMTESMSTNVSTRPMLFYNDTKGISYINEDGSTDSPKALLNVIADNIVIQPKKYTLEILIPMNMSSEVLYGKSYATSIINTYLIANKKLLNGQLLRASNITFGILSSLYKGLYGLEVNATNIVNMLLQQQDYNKASIEYMWRNRRILKLKMWNGWKFKHLAIVDFSVVKEGKNGDFSEGVLTCQEMPIMTIRNNSKQERAMLSGISAALGNAQKVVADAFIKAMSSTLSEEVK